MECAEKYLSETKDYLKNIAADDYPLRHLVEEVSQNAEGGVIDFESAMNEIGNLE